MKMTSSLAGLAITHAFVSGRALVQQPATVRLDYIHSGNALSEQYAIERVLIEPLPWPGDMSRRFDDTNRGNNRVEVADAKTGAVSTNRCGCERKHRIS
jgi:hypothetical protein